MSAPDRHLFVCVNRRPPGGKPSCGARGGEQVFTALQEAVGRRPELWGRIAVTSTGCLGPCFEGPVVVVYPDGTWYAPVSPADADELVAQHVVLGVPVTRLRRGDAEDNDT